jgi:dimethylhistidine N-methyltransferase
MEKQNQLRIFSAAGKDLWRPAERSIWTAASHSDGDEALALTKSLLDQPRWLAPHHLYDDRGSELFDRICELAEYYPTRTESAILKQRAAEIVRLSGPDCIVELGAGTSQKTLLLLNEFVKQRGGGVFAPIDVSLASLRIARDSIERNFPKVAFVGLHGKYEEGVASIEKNLPTLFLFLGSTVGNFDHSQFSAFFEHVSKSMGGNDYFLLGVDRVKEAALLEKAYDDAQGLTAEFILNVFQNANRIIGSDFDKKKMRYFSRYNTEWRRVEMYAVAAETHEIRIPMPPIAFRWEKGEKILVEISRKFDPEQLQSQLRCFGLDPVAHYTDEKNWFSLLLFKKAAVSGR